MSTEHHHHHGRSLYWVTVILACACMAEYAGSIWARSQVLRADAFHMLSDVAAILISLIAIKVAARPDADKLPFLFRRAEVFAAFANGVGLCVIVVEIVREGIEALSHKREPAGELMMVVSLSAFVMNSFCVWLLHRDHNHDHTHDHQDHASESHNLNIRSARLHLLGDLFGSIAAFIASVVIRLGGPPVVDVAAAFTVAAILSYGAYKLLRESVRVLIR